MRLSLAEKSTDAVRARSDPTQCTKYRRHRSTAALRTEGVARAPFSAGQIELEMRLRGMSSAALQSCRWIALEMQHNDSPICKSNNKLQKVKAFLESAYEIADIG